MLLITHAKYIAVMALVWNGQITMHKWLILKQILKEAESKFLPQNPLLSDWGYSKILKVFISKIPPSKSFIDSRTFIITVALQPSMSSRTVNTWVVVGITSESEGPKLKFFSSKN